MALFEASLPAQMGTDRVNVEMPRMRAGRGCPGVGRALPGEGAERTLHTRHCTGRSTGVFADNLLRGASQCVLGFSSGVGLASAVKLLPQGRRCL